MRSQKASKMADDQVEPRCKRMKFDSESEENVENTSADVLLKSSSSSQLDTGNENEQENVDAREQVETQATKDSKELEEDLLGDKDSIPDDVSELSDVSGLSEEAWKPTAGPMSWVHRQMINGQDPRSILQHLIPSDTTIPDDIDDFTLWKLVINILSEPPKRKKLGHINTLEDVLHLIKTCSKVMVLTGAGVSVSCGIPDFRSRNGIYARLAVDFPDLPDPQAMFDIRYFRNDPRPFFKFAKEIYPGQFEPSKCHKFIHLIESNGKLLRNYTQNIDTLEQVAGINNVIQCHGSFATAKCMTCGYKVDAEAIRKDIFEQVIPKCPKCAPSDEMSVIKPDIVFFGESLPEEFHRQMSEDKDVCDLLIVIGSSLKVRPVALIPNSLPANVPQVLINKEPLKHLNFDVELLGDCDTIVQELCRRLGEGWDGLADSKEWFEETTKDRLPTPPVMEATENCWCGSELGVNGLDSKEKKTKIEQNRISGSDQGVVIETSECTENSVDLKKESADIQGEILKTGQYSGEDYTRTEDSSVGKTNDATSCQCYTEITVSGNKERNSDEGLSALPSKEEAVTSTSCSNEVSVEMQENLQDTEDSTRNRTSSAETENSSGGDEGLLSSSTADVSGSSSHRPHHHHCRGRCQKELGECMGPVRDSDLEVMRSFWHARHNESISNRLADNQYLFMSPNRYVFHGAEVYSDDEGAVSDGDSDSDDSDFESERPDDSKNITQSEESELNTSMETGGASGSNAGRESEDSICDLETQYVGADGNMNKDLLDSDKVHSLNNEHQNIQKPILTNVECTYEKLNGDLGRSVSTDCFESAPESDRTCGGVEPVS